MYFKLCRFEDFGFLFPPFPPESNKFEGFTLGGKALEVFFVPLNNVPCLIGWVTYETSWVATSFSLSLTPKSCQVA